MNVEKQMQIDQFNFPVATANTETMLKEGVQAFRTANGSLCVTSEWLSNNAHLLGGWV